jgi:GT2 family glycosyltransferase
MHIAPGDQPGKPIDPLEAQQTIARLKVELSEQKDIVKTLTTQTTRLQRQLMVVQNIADVASKEIHAIHNAKIWRLMNFFWRIRGGFKQFLRRLIGQPTPAPKLEVPTVIPPSPPSHVPPGTHCDILCFPIIDWEFRFQRPQQLLTQFALHGHRIFYLRTSFGTGGQFSMHSLGENIYEVQLPGKKSIVYYRDVLDENTLETAMRSLEELREHAEIGEVICLVHAPFWGPLALAARQRWGWKVVYDCLDEHSAVINNSTAVVNAEPALIIESNLVVATAKRLYERIAPQARQALLLPNAANFEHFNYSSANAALAGVPGPIIGYYGLISDRFDIDMVYKAAKSNPAWQFALIGEVMNVDISSLQSLPNVLFLGEQPYMTLPGYLRRFDVACIPFRINPLTLATNPVKFYEYMSLGKPVVAVEIPELEPFRELFYPVHNSNEFAAQIQAALRENDPSKVDARIQFARENSWLARYQTLSPVLMQLYKKVIIVIVSHNNLQYLELCLESLWTKTLYPNFDVIVVDNASENNVRDYLLAAAHQEPRLKVILNNDNLGFARANNIGIEAAGSCDYVVLLNNDTVVTPHWLSKLISHLDDPQVGLVGPVSNWAANEARINVNYTDLEGMEQFAKDYTQKHAGQYFEIHMLAMYCVATRRSLLETIGLLDERFGIGMFEDDDFAMRVHKAGYKTICAEDVFIHHWGRASFSRLDQTTYDQLFEENRKKFEGKWGMKWQPHQARIGEGI